MSHVEKHMDLICRKGTPFEALNGRTAPSSDGLLAEVFWSFTQLKGKCQEICAQPPGSLSLAADVTDAKLGASGLWQGTRTGAGGTATLA